MSQRRRGGIHRLARSRLSDVRDSAWFDHPEMQARIARAEADLREGRFVDLHSNAEIFSYFDSFGAARRQQS